MRSLDRLFKSRLNGTGLKPLVQYIKDLFSNNEQGVWYDPSDLSTLYQDATGTIPVTAVEQPVGLMLDKSKGLVLGSERKQNFVTGLGGAATPATYDPATGNGTVARVDLSNQSFVHITGLPSSSTYKMSISNTGSVGIVVRQLDYAGTAVASVPVGATVTLHFSGSANAVITAAGGTASFTLNSFAELPGNHASQTTATSRPVLSARVNQFLNSELTGAVAGAPGTPPTSWLSGNSTGEIGTSAVGVRFVANATRRTAYQSIVLAANTAYRMRCKVNVAVPFAVSQMLGTTTAAVFSVQYYCDGQAVSSNFAPSVGEHEVVLDFVSPSTSGNFTIQIGAGVQNTTTGDVTFLKTDFRPANTGTNLPDYQRVNTATDYDTAGFPYYLKFDGTDDWLVTPSINFTSTDKMMVCAGIRKLSDAATGFVVTFSDSVTSYSGTFWLLSPSANGAADYNWRSRGSINNPSAIKNGYPPPLTNVVTGIGDIANDISLLKVNGAQAAFSSSDQGTGNYGNFPLFIGGLSAAARFNGHLYSLIIRGAATSASQIKSVERYVNTKTRAYTT